MGEDIYKKEKAENNKEVNKPTETIINKIGKNNEIKGMIALTGGVTIAAFAIGGVVILKSALIGIGSIYLITKGVTFLVKANKKR